MSDIKILSFNCRGLASSEKRIDCFNYLKSKKCHIYCLQDIHCTRATENFIRTQWGNNECIFSSFSSNSRGVGIFFNYNNIDFKIHSHISDPDGNYLIADLTVDNNRFILITLYGPNNDCPSTSWPSWPSWPRPSVGSRRPEVPQACCWSPPTGLRSSACLGRHCKMSLLGYRNGNQAN